MNEREIRSIFREVGLSYLPELRGRKGRKGRPDTVIWIELDEIESPPLFPILIEEEYESGFEASLEDFELFAERGKDFRSDSASRWNSNIVRIPHVVEHTAKEAVCDQQTMLYDINGTSPLEITGEQTRVSEKTIHRKARQWCRDRSGNHKTCTVQSGGPDFQVMKLHPNIFGKEFTIRIPIVHLVDEVDFRRLVRNLKIPSLSVVPRGDSTRCASQLYETVICTFPIQEDRLSEFQ